MLGAGVGIMRASEPLAFGGSWVGTTLTIPIVILEMGRHFIPFLHDLIAARTSVWLQLVLATPVVLWAGWPFFVRGWASVRTRNLNMFTLIAMGTGIAWLFSVIATVAPQIFPASLRTMGGMVHVYFEAAAVITTLVLLGQVLESKGRCARTTPWGRESGRQNCHGQVLARKGKRVLTHHILKNIALPVSPFPK